MLDKARPTATSSANQHNIQDMIYFVSYFFLVLISDSLVLTLVHGVCLVGYQVIFNYLSYEHLQLTKNSIQQANKAILCFVLLTGKSK